MNLEYSVKADAISGASVKYDKKERAFSTELPKGRESFSICLCPTNLEIIVDLEGLFVTGFRGRLEKEDVTLKSGEPLPQRFDGKICVKLVDCPALKNAKFVVPFKRGAVYDGDKKTFTFGKIPDDSVTVRVCENLLITVGDDEIEAVTVTGV